MPYHTRADIQRTIEHALHDPQMLATGGADLALAMAMLGVLLDIRGLLISFIATEHSGALPAVLAQEVTSEAQE